MLWNFSNFVIDANACLHYNLSENCKGVIIVDEIMEALEGLTTEQKRSVRDYLRYLLALECKQEPLPLTQEKGKESSERFPQ